MSRGGLPAPTRDFRCRGGLFGFENQMLDEGFPGCLEDAVFVG